MTLSDTEAHELARDRNRVSDQQPIPEPPADLPALQKQAPPEMRVTVVGVQRTPSGHYVYRTSTRDGHYVGRTNPTRVRAVKGDVLRVQPNLFKQTEHGDFLWVNPNVMGRALGRSFERKLLEAYAGGRVDKDVPLPPAGDTAPTAADAQRAAAITPTGPTLNGVHVPRPLKRISVMYANVSKDFCVHKADEHQQIAYGVVLEPNTIDSQMDYVPAHHVERAAHRFLKNAIRGRNTVHRIQHGRVGFRRDKPSIVPVESFIAPADFTYNGRDWIKKGSWVLAAHVEDPKLWQQFLDGEYTGWSVGGTGLRRRLGKPAVV